MNVDATTDNGIMNYPPTRNIDDSARLSDADSDNLHSEESDNADDESYESYVTDNHTMQQMDAVRQQRVLDRLRTLQEEGNDVEDEDDSIVDGYALDGLPRGHDDEDYAEEDFAVNMLRSEEEDDVCRNGNDNIVLIWDTGAAKHLFEYVPDDAYLVRNRKNKVLLGGSSNHAVCTSTVFDAGFLNGVLLLPESIKIGYNIISAGQLSQLRTVQDTNGKFYVLNTDGDVISIGHVEIDKIFYLDDKNLLMKRDSVRHSHRLQVSMRSNPTNFIYNSATDNKNNRKKYSIIQKSRLSKINIITRRGNGKDFEGVKRSNARITKRSDSRITKRSDGTVIVTGTKQETDESNNTKSVSFADPIEISFNDPIETKREQEMRTNIDDSENSTITIVNGDGPIVNEEAPASNAPITIEE
jgi:hypothetical protein